jgi:rod shape determining protein RodA
VIGIKYPDAILYIVVAIVIIGGLRFLFLRKKTFQQILFTVLAIVYFGGLMYSSAKVIEKMPEHQTGRIKVWLGLKVSREIEDRYGYNTKQSMIAIGSGGLLGKGYLDGTQTKFRFVPEQETDFIFCTVGEEWGFVGSTVVVLLYSMLIVRLIIRSERQRSDFTRIYGYAVASIFLFHLLVNVGMTIGLLPVIGIPLPFFSYGGSSLISFTILLFIFVKLDSQRLLILR